MNKALIILAALAIPAAGAAHHGWSSYDTEQVLRLDARFTSVGTRAVFRFARPVCYQGFPDATLPPELRNANPRGIERLVDGVRTRDSLSD